MEPEPSGRLRMATVPDGPAGGTDCGRVVIGFCGRVAVRGGSACVAAIASAAGGIE
jgi:hypothetical protein